MNDNDGVTGEEERLAADPLDDADLELLDSLAQRFEHYDPVPPHLSERIEFTLTLARLYDEVEQLQSRELTASGTRAEGESPTMMTFSGSAVSLMLSTRVLATGTVRVDGWVVPNGWRVSLTLMGVQDPIDCTTDAEGRFVVDSVPAVLAQFTVTPENLESTEKAFITPMFTL